MNTFIRQRVAADI